jgi:hypothetical protein
MQRALNASRSEFQQLKQRMVEVQGYLQHLKSRQDLLETAPPTAAPPEPKEFPEVGLGAEPAPGEVCTLPGCTVNPPSAAPPPKQNAKRSKHGCWRWCWRWCWLWRWLWLWRWSWRWCLRWCWCWRWPMCWRRVNWYTIPSTKNIFARATMESIRQLLLDGPAWPQLWTLNAGMPNHHRILDAAHGSRFTALGSHGSRLTAHGSRLTRLAARGARLTAHGGFVTNGTLSK